MAWTYSQSTGKLFHDGRLVATGYSGMGRGRNNPDEEATPNVGPIPCGHYRIGPPHDTQTHGPHVMALDPGNRDMLGRSGFLIHGDNINHTASQGCIILSRDIRDRISQSNDTDLEVTR